MDRPVFLVMRQWKCEINTVYGSSQTPNIELEFFFSCHCYIFVVMANNLANHFLFTYSTNTDRYYFEFV